GEAGPLVHPAERGARLDKHWPAVPAKGDAPVHDAEGPDARERRAQPRRREGPDGPELYEAHAHSALPRLVHGVHARAGHAAGGYEGDLSVLHAVFAQHSAVAASEGGGELRV